MSAQLEVREEPAVYKVLVGALKTVSLAEAAELNPRRHTAPPTDSDLVSFVPMRSVSEESGLIDGAAVRPWAEVKKGYTAFQNGDVIVAKITPCMENGKFALATALHGGRAAGSTEFHVFRPKPVLLPKYLLHFLFTPAVRRGAKMNMKGAAGQLRVPIQYFESLSIPLPPVEQQAKVVAYLDEQLSRLDASVAALHRVQANLKRYRASVLKAACEGRLVATEVELARHEGRESQIGERLLQRILEERRLNWPSKGKYETPLQPAQPGQGALPSGWSWAAVGQLLSERLCNGLSIKGADTPPGVRALRLNAMTSERFDYSQARYLPIDEAKVSDILIRGGDYFVSRGNGSLDLVGRGTLAQAPPSSVIFPDTMIRLRFTPSIAGSQWIRLIWESRWVREQIERKVKTTAGIFKISQPELESIVVPLPPLPEQHRIVAEADRRLSLTRAVEATVAANLARAQRLRQSILQAAFSA